VTEARRLQPKLQPNGVAPGGTRRRARDAEIANALVSATIQDSARPCANQMNALERWNDLLPIVVMREASRFS
jgi:hypothetical protein